MKQPKNQPFSDKFWWAGLKLPPKQPSGSVDAALNPLFINNTFSEPQLSLFAEASPRRPAVGGNKRAYPRRPFPTIAVLVIDPAAGSMQRRFIRATATGIKSVFPIQRTTFQEINGYRVYATPQDWEQVTNRTILPGWELSPSGPLLITGTKFSELDGHTAEELMRHTIFSCFAAAREPGVLQQRDCL